MTSSRSFATGIVACVLAAGALSGCSSDEPAVCSSMKLLKSSALDYQQANDSFESIDDDFGSLGEVRKVFNEVKTDAKEQFAPEIDGLETSLDAASSALADAKANPSPATLRALKPAATQVDTSFKTLSAAVANTC